MRDESVCLVRDQILSVLVFSVHVDQLIVEVPEYAVSEPDSEAVS